MLMLADFGSNSNWIGVPPDKSYSVRSAVSAKSWASLSVLKAGILFFITFDLLPVHVAGAYRPDITVPAALPDREDNKDGPSLFGPANGAETRFGPQVASAGQDGNRAGKHALDFRPGNAVFPAMFEVSMVPVEP
jgi:hypothetical protein